MGSSRATRHSEGAERVKNPLYQSIVVRRHLVTERWAPQKTAGRSGGLGHE